MRGHPFGIIFAVVGATLLAAASSTSADVLFKQSGGGVLRDDATATVGVRFTASDNSINVTHLGYYDDDQDGNVVAHRVGLWSDTGTLLREVTVQAGTASMLFGEFRYEQLATPIALVSGTTYRLGSEVFLSSGDRWEDLDNSFVLGAPVHTLSGVYHLAASFGFPENTAGAGAYLGANFMFPEPSTACLLGFGALLLVQRRQRAPRATM